MSWLIDLRARLAEPPPRRLPAGQGTQAAVLVPLYVAAGELWLLFVEREAGDRSEAARSTEPGPELLALPGGAVTAGEEAWDAAVRAAGEEIGLPAAQALPLGELDELGEPTALRIVPCVAAVPGPELFTARPAPGRVRETFGVPLSALADPMLVEEREVVVDGAVHRLPVHHIGRRRIWGATAVIVENLLGRLEMV